MRHATRPTPPTTTSPDHLSDSADSNSTHSLGDGPPSPWITLARFLLTRNGFVKRFNLTSHHPGLAPDPLPPKPAPKPGLSFRLY